MRKLYSVLFMASLVGCSSSAPSNTFVPGDAPRSAAYYDSYALGTVPLASSYSILHTFDGGTGDGVHPVSSLVSLGGLLYGTTSLGGSQGGGKGTVFQLNVTGQEKILVRFKGGADGSRPYAGLVSVDGILYGTTWKGGVNGKGLVFAVTTAGVETVLYSFKGGGDGALPRANLINVGGTLYGTTSQGGTANLGTVFSVTRTGHEKVLYSFKGGSDGATPVSGLVASGGLLYGTTETGGSSTCTLSTAGCGIVFSLTKGGAEKILYRFGGADGAMPRAGLLISNGTIYGTTYSGGSKSAGTVFALAKSGTERVLHSFGNGQDGQGPNAGLSSAGGVFYGTTAGGGNSYGTVFQISRSGAERVIYRFKPSQDGRYPRASVLPQNDVLFGTTENGGTGGSDDGIAFRVSP